MGARAAGHIPSVCTVDVAEEPAASRFVGGSRLICLTSFDIVVVRKGVI